MGWGTLGNLLKFLRKKNHMTFYTRENNNSPGKQGFEKKSAFWNALVQTLWFHTTASALLTKGSAELQSLGTFGFIQIADRLTDAASPHRSFSSADGRSSGAKKMKHKRWNIWTKTYWGSSINYLIHKYVIKRRIIILKKKGKMIIRSGSN